MKGAIAIALALLGLAGCAPGQGACPAADFDGFLAQFRESVALQRAYVRTPLNYGHVVQAEPEPAQISEKQSLDQIRFPLIATSAQLQAQGIGVSVKTTAAGTMVSERRPDSDSWVVDYSFLKSGGCWKLAAVDDQSL